MLKFYVYTKPMVKVYSMKIIFLNICKSIAIYQDILYLCKIMQIIFQ